MVNEMFIYGRKIKKIENKFYDIITNKLYMLLFYHDATGGNLWTSNEDAKHKETNPTKYSILSNLTEEYKTKKNYQFLLEYPELNTYVIWQQSIDPLSSDIDNTGEKVAGFKPIRVNQPKFCGLSLSKSTNCLLDGETTTGWWSYAIGVYKDYFAPNYIPGPSTNMVNHVALWVHFPLQSQYTCKAKIQFRFIRFVSFANFAFN